MVKKYNTKYQGRQQTLNLSEIAKKYFEIVVKNLILCCDFCLKRLHVFLISALQGRALLILDSHC